jgi:hypothetical protein
MCILLLVIIDDFHIKRVPVFPTEANTPLIVEPNRILTGAVSSKRFEPEARRFEVV